MRPLSRIKNALLILQQGSVFSGYSIGYSGQCIAELVFNTAMTGYQEILTDPSYAEQIVTFTYPHIGNTGVNEVDMESLTPMVKGLVIRDLPSLHSNYRSTGNLSSYLSMHKIVAIAGIDTRELTKILREQGAQPACIVAVAEHETISATLIDSIKQLLAQHPGMIGQDLASQVSTPKRYVWRDPITTPLCFLPLREETQRRSTHSNLPRFKVIVYDFGVKHNILRILSAYGCELELVPAATPATDVIQNQPDGVILSNGPGDPEACTYAIDNIKTLLANKIPLLGICLGFQLLALAIGAQTKKMKFGHHGANHPVQNLMTQQVFISSQNHGFEVDETTLPDDVHITHRSLFDHSLQGFKLAHSLVYGFQGHPEASPGPHDIMNVFQPFIDDMRQVKQTVH